MIKFKMLKAEEYCDSVRDGTHDSPKKVKTGFKLITSKHIKEYGLDLDNAYYISEKDFKKVNERSAVDINDILYSMIGTIGLMYRVESQPNYAIKNMGLFKVSDETKSKWLYYYLKSPKMKSYIQSLLNGSTQQYITLSNLRQLPIELPENENDMKNIIRILDLIDKKIKLNVQTNDNLYEIGIELLKNDFTVVKEKKTLSQVIKFVKGKKPNDISNNKHVGYEKYLTIACLNGQELNYADTTKMVMSNNDLLMVMDGASSGEVYYGGYGIVGSTLSRVDCTDNNFISEFVYFVLKYYKNLIQSKNTGSAIPHTDKVFVSSLEIPILDIEQQVKYKVLLNKIQQNQNENEILSQLRDTLLPKLMNGEIDLDKIEI